MAALVSPKQVALALGVGAAVADHLVAAVTNGGTSLPEGLEVPPDL